MRSAIAWLATLVLAAAQAAFAQEARPAGELSAGTGVQYSSGDYGSGTTTKIVSVPFIARYESGPLVLKATVPWLKVSGATPVIPGIGRVSNGNPKGRGRGGVDSEVSGLGDSVLSATYAVVRESASGPGFDVTGRVKLATGDRDEGLGTGENDAGFQVDAYKTLERITYFAGVGYTAFGKSDFIPLKNAWNATVGGSYRIDERDSAGVSGDFRQRVSDTAEPQRELMAFFTRKLDRQWKAQAYVLKGFSDGSPDWGFGVLGFYAF